MRLAMFSVLASVFLTPALPASAGPLESGVAAQNGADYATALRLLSPLAEQGNAIAQFNLVARFIQIAGYRLLSLMRASSVVKCHSAMA